MVMKARVLLCAALVCPVALVAGQGQSKPAPVKAATEIPHLRKQGTATQLIVEGKPYLALAGELSNSTATSVEYMKMVWPRLVAQKQLNTVLAGVSWNQIEPQEGKFDFSVLDGVIQGARAHNMRLVLLWFATWKNGLSSYPPDWVKRDFDRFPRAAMIGDQTPWPVFGNVRGQVTGSLNIELMSPYGERTREADAHALAAMMRHIKAVDGHEHTVLMIQVENETGLQGDTRDRSPAALKAFDGPVPKELMDYLVEHKATLIPALSKVWEAAGFKTSGTWAEVFGKVRAADEIFMAWSFARYIERVVEAGKAEYPIPMVTNCPQDGFGRAPAPLKGGGQSGGAMPDAFDVWRAGAPKIDMFGADIYSTDFVGFCTKYAQSGNPLFIPETRYNMEAKSMYAFGRFDAVGLSLMGVERSPTPEPEMIRGFELISQLAPLISKHQGNGTMTAVWLNPNDPPQKIQLGNYTLEVARLGAGRAAPPPATPAAAPAAGRGATSGPSTPPAASAAIFIATGPDEYYAAGTDVSVSFTPNTPGPEHAGIGTVEEGTFVNGRWVASRQLAGDETGEGQNLSLRSHPVDRIPDAYVGIQRFTLYRYR
jgi:hypothetical protein